MSEVHVVTLSQNVWIVFESDGSGISRDRAEDAKLGRNGPVKSVDRFGVGEVRIVGDDHHVALECAVVVDIDISPIRGGWIEVSGCSANPRLQDKRTGAPC